MLSLDDGRQTADDGQATHGQYPSGTISSMVYRHFLLAGGNKCSQLIEIVERLRI